ncbi:MAG: hypothetical protein MUQ65_08630, partial [Armatimonadetes bacterium]|nr:hypothetical protein [Armatimonadota bacterium]
LVSRVETAGNAEAVAVADEIAYVAAGSGGVVAFDVSDPTDPEQLWVCSEAGVQAMDVAVSGDFAYVADWDAKLRVLDVSAPTAVVCAYGSAAVSGHPNGIAVSGNRA